MGGTQFLYPLDSQTIDAEETASEIIVRENCGVNSFGQLNLESGHRSGVLVGLNVGIDLLAVKPNVSPCVGEIGGAEGRIGTQ